MKNKELKVFAKSFLKLIKKHDYIIIFHHINPDGDCLGSQHGLKHWLKNKYPNKKIYAIGNNESLFNFLSWEFDEIPNDEILNKSLGIVVDANYSNRIKHGELIVENKIKKTIRIDHHPEKDDIDYVLRFVDDSYCASAEQISDLISFIDKKYKNPIVSTFLYLGIYTDSGRFFYNKTSIRTHLLTSWLLSSNFDFDFVHKNLSKKTTKEVEFNKEVLNNYKTYKNVIYYFISNEKAKLLKLSSSQINRVDFLANIEGYDVWIFFIEDGDNNIRVRFRSNIKNVNSLARQYGGGGHILASGAIIKDKNLIEEIVKKASDL